MVIWSSAMGDCNFGRQSLPRYCSWKTL